MPRIEIPARYMAEFRRESNATLAKLDLTSGKAVRMAAVSDQ
jgi:hypothetical protein